MPRRKPSPDRLPDCFTRVAAELAELGQAMLAREEAAAEPLSRLDGDQRRSAVNLLHYLAMRSRDLRGLQDDLAELGLSSLGRCEPAVLATQHALADLLGRCGAHLPRPTPPPIASIAEGRDLLARRTEALLGPAPAGREVRIMVTLPSQAAGTSTLVYDLLAAGMNCMRINCAHDSPEDWERMIAHLRRAQNELGRPCQVQMDLAGPKLRTGALPPGPEVVKCRPTRDVLGRPTAPARLWLTADEAPRPAPAPAAAALPLPRAFLARLRPRDRLHLVDARDAHRELVVAELIEGGAWAEAWTTAYITTGTALTRKRGRARACVGQLPPTEQALRLRRGSRLTLTRDPAPGDTAALTIPCSLPQVFADVRPGDAVWFDDGKIGGRVIAATAEEMTVEITQAAAAGSKLGADKGINLPDTELSLPCLTAEDLEHLPFVVRHADLVGYSFVRRASDVVRLQEELGRLDGEHLGIVLKVETRHAFERLPELLLAALASPRAGVMIARGDLAVECGWERLAELQEEILWLCEAAHVPVIWATQVLEGLAKRGQPSRAEITDAAMGERAECVMLNKGPYILDAVRVLDDILQRMQAHQRKKRPMMRLLRVAGPPT